jgi:hypothetical protein
MVCKVDVVKYILSTPVLKGRLGKWMPTLAEFDQKYESEKAMKGQVLADLLVEHDGFTIYVELMTWTLIFDGSMSSTQHKL